MKFESSKDYIDYYFDTAYQLVDEKYSSFRRNIIIKILRGLHKAMIDGLEIHEIVTQKKENY